MCIASDAQATAHVKCAWQWLCASGLEVHITCANAYLQALLREVSVNEGNGYAHYCSPIFFVSKGLRKGGLLSFACAKSHVSHFLIDWILVSLIFGCVVGPILCVFLDGGFIHFICFAALPTTACWLLKLPVLLQCAIAKCYCRVQQSRALLFSMAFLDSASCFKP